VVSSRGRTSAPPTLDQSGDVTTLELFFDLVFVFALTRLTSVVREADGPGRLAQAALVLIVLWWMYDGFAWMTNNVATTSTLRRLFLLTGMAALLIAAVAVPDAFGHDGVIFGLAYLVLVLIHAGMFTAAQSSLSARAIWAIGPYNLTCAVLVLVAGWFTGTTDYLLWGAAVGVLVLAMLRRAETGFELRPAHFAERHGLIVIIALGESVVDLGVGAEGRLHDVGTVVTALLGLALAAVLWWLYFASDDEAGARALAGMTAEGRARGAMYAYSVGILVLVAGIVLAAAGLETTVAGPHGRLASSAAWSLSAGVATYLLGLGLFRRLLRWPGSWLRAATAVPALACVLLGIYVSGPVEIAALTVAVALTIPLEH
jgi:low temperature requirement protein LtrA